MGAGDHVPEVSVDSVDVEKFAVFIPIVSPGIGGAVGEDFEGLAVGMKTPDASFDRNALGFGRPGNADIAGAGTAAASVKPTIGAPAEAVGKVVVVVLGDGKAIEDDFGFAIGNIVLIAVGDEEELWRAHGPNPTASQFDTGEHLQLVGEDLAGVGLSVVVFVVKNDNAIAQFEIEAPPSLGIGVVFGDPHTAFVIPGHRDGILDFGLGCEDRHLKSFGEFE